MQHDSFEPSTLDETITALGSIWKQTFKQLHNPNATEDDIQAMSIASTELLRQVLRLSRENYTSVISREQLRHLNVEDEHDSRVIETQRIVKELKVSFAEGFGKIDRLLDTVVTDHTMRIEALEKDVRDLKDKINA